MRCQGRPEDGRCPDNKNDNTVHNTIGDLFLCNACEEYRWPTVGATAKLPISGAFVSRKPNTRQSMKSTTDKSNTKKAPSKGRVHAISISNNSGNDGHDDEIADKFQSPSSPGRNHDHDAEQNATFMNDDIDQTTSTSCSVCLMSSNSDDISCDICKAVYHVKCLPVPPKLHEHLKTLITNIGWVCDTCRVSACNTIQKLLSAVSVLTQELASVQQQLQSKVQDTASPPDAGSNSSGSNRSGTVNTANPEISAEANITADRTSDTNVCIVVHKTLEDLQQRKSNVVVTGLPETHDVDSDCELFVNFCSEHLSIKPHVSGCARLGKKINDQPRRLLIKLTAEQSVEQLLKDARKLRNSADALASSVFFNPDLSPQQRQLAFEARCRKRQRKVISEQKRSSATSGAEVLHEDTIGLSSLSNQQPITAAATNTTAIGIDQHPGNSASSDTDQQPEQPQQQQQQQPDPTIDSNRFQPL